MGKTPNLNGKSSHAGAKKTDRTNHWKYGKTSGKNDPKLQK